MITRSSVEQQFELKAQLKAASSSRSTGISRPALQSQSSHLSNRPKQESYQAARANLFSCQVDHNLRFTEFGNISQKITCDRPIEVHGKVPSDFIVRARSLTRLLVTSVASPQDTLLVRAFRQLSWPVQRHGLHALQLRQ